MVSILNCCILTLHKITVAAVAHILNWSFHHHKTVEEVVMVDGMSCLHIVEEEGEEEVSSVHHS